MVTEENNPYPTDTNTSLLAGTIKKKFFSNLLTVNNKILYFIKNVVFYKILTLNNKR
jgi:hypothetical protein